MEITFSRWDNYYKTQMKGKINMFGFDMDIQKNYDECFKHFEEDKKKEVLVFDYCSNCEKDIIQKDLGEGAFGCPKCKRTDCIELEKCKHSFIDDFDKSICRKCGGVEE